MRNRRVILSGVLAVLIAIATGALLLSRALGASRASALEVIFPTPKCPGPPYAPLGVQVGQELGAPSITPRNNCTPSFTVQDVLNYEHAHPFSNMRMMSIGQPKVTKVLFITSAQASQRIGGEWIGLPDDALVCFVELYGTYRFMPPFGIESSVHTGTMHDTYDAHIGNLIVSGG